MLFLEGKNDIDIHLDYLTARQRSGVSASHSDYFEKADSVCYIQSVFFVKNTDSIGAPHP